MDSISFAVPVTKGRTSLFAKIILPFLAVVGVMCAFTDSGFNNYSPSTFTDQLRDDQKL